MLAQGIKDSMHGIGQILTCKQHCPVLVARSQRHPLLICGRELRGMTAALRRTVVSQW